MSLRTALTSPTPLAGCLALSCYLPGDPGSYKSCDHQVPILQVSHVSHALDVLLLYTQRELYLCESTPGVVVESLIFSM